MPMSEILFDHQTNSSVNSTKKFSEIPFLIPIRYQHINIVGVVVRKLFFDSLISFKQRNYHLSRAQRVFLTFYDSRSR
jgi:hypothetical protein